jgi:endonuclease/exonuclease/phosphatase family metal-dependent hydrolase
LVQSALRTEEQHVHHHTIHVLAFLAAAGLGVQGCSSGGSSSKSKSASAAAGSTASSTSSTVSLPPATTPITAAPGAWIPVGVNVPTGPLFDLPPGYMANGGDPVFVPSLLESDSFSDRNPQVVPPRRKMVVWNVEKGLDTLEVEQELQHHPDLAGADFILLQECPRRDTKSVPAQINLARQLAQVLRMDYVFACEWDFRHARPNGGENGTAILSKYPLGNVEQLRFKPMLPYWKLHDRLGGPLTVVADANVGGQLLRIYNVHLMVADLGVGRLYQQRDLLADAADPSKPPMQIYAGDLNTWFYGANEPVIAELLADGWTDALNFGPNAYTQVGAGVLPQLLDWSFVRGLPGTYSGFVATNAKGADHLPLVMEFQVR